MLQTTEKTPFQDHPNSEYRYFVYDPFDQIMLYYKSTEEQLNAAKDIIQGCKADDNLWAEEAGQVLMGEITHITVEKVLECRPEREDYTTEQAFNNAMEEWPYGDDVNAVSDFVICPIEGNHD